MRNLIDAVPQLLYHGTSLVQFEKMVSEGFVVTDLYFGEDRENITDHYAEKQAEIDDSFAVTLVVDAGKLRALRNDEHQSLDGAVPQLGQFIFSGDLKPALVTALVFNHETGEETELPL